MSEFHYVRTRGADGGVDACEGPAIGVDLETVLSKGLPPWNIALEIVAALCEILDIADEDGEIHGDVSPKYVFIDETGAVSLEAFGVKRQESRAPERVPADTRTDLYGLGYTAYQCFCSHPLPDVVPTEAQAHDDLVVDAALEIDLSDVPEAVQGDIQWYIAKLMDFDPTERPTALDAWRSFIAFANSWQGGVDMSEWCAAALDGGGARRAERPRGEAPAEGEGAPSADPPPDEEDLGGPVVLKGPLTGKFAFDDPGGGSGGAKGATAFWSRQDIKRALESTPAPASPPSGPLATPDAPDAPKPPGPAQTVFLGGNGSEEQLPGPSSTPFVPTPAEAKHRPPMGAGGGQATAFWSQDQLDAMERGDASAPRPRRAEGEGERRRVTAIQRLPGPTLRPHTSEPPISEPTVPDGSNRPVSSGPPRPATAPPPTRPLPPASRPAIEPAKSGGGMTFVLFGGGLAAFGVLAAVIVVLILIVVLVAVSWPRDTDTTVPPLPTPAPIDVAPVPVDPVAPEPQQPDPTEEATPAPVPEPRPDPRPARPRPTPVPARPTPAPRTQPAAPRPQPAAPIGDNAKVSVRSSGRGSVSGCSTTKIEFEGRGDFTIEKYKLPATCLVVIDGAREVFQVYGSGEVTCNKQGTVVVCDKQIIP